MEEKNTVMVENKKEKKVSKTAWGWWVLGLVMPIAGYVLYLVWKGKNERDSQSSGWGALLGCALYVVLFLVWALFIK